MSRRAVLALLLVTVLVLASGAVLAVRRAKTLIERQIASAVDADVRYGDLSVDVVSAFPRVAVHVIDLEVTGREPFAGVPLLAAAELEAVIDLRSVLFGDTVEITALHLAKPVLNWQIDAEGRSNTDVFAGDSTDEPSSALHFEDVQVDELTLTYDDANADQHLQIGNLTLSISAQVEATASQFDGKLAIGSLTASSAGVTWLAETRWDYHGQATVRGDSGAVELAPSTLTINALPLSIAGSFTPAGEDWDVNVEVAAGDATFASLLSLVPAAYQGSMEGVDSAGTVAFRAAFDGRYVSASGDWPGFDAALTVQGARFRYPDRPSAVDGIDLDLGLKHPQGSLDLTEFDVRSLTFRVGRDLFSARGTVRNPISDPVVDLTARGRLDLRALRSALPMDADMAPPSGTIDVDLAVKGAASAFQAGKVGEIRATGRFSATDLQIDDGAYPVDSVVDRLEVGLDPSGADVRTLSLHYTDRGGARSDLAADGRLDHVLGYLFGAGDTLAGRLTVRSDRLDGRPFQGLSDAEGDDGLLVAVPANLRLTVDLDLRQVVTEQITFDKVSGQLVIADGAVSLKDVKASTLGGTVRLAGQYAAPTAEQADMDVTIAAVKVDLPRMLKAFPTTGKIAPILAGATGKLDLDLSLATRLARDGTPQLATARSEGTIRPAGVKVTPASLRKPANQLGDAGYATIDLGNSALSYVLKAGRAQFSPAQLKLGVIPATLGGSVGVVDETLDLTLGFQVPTKLATSLVPSLSSVLGKDVDIVLKIGGTYADPKVSFGGAK